MVEGFFQWLALLSRTHPESSSWGVPAELRSYVKVDVAVLDSPSLIVRYDLCGHKATLKLQSSATV